MKVKNWVPRVDKRYILGAYIILNTFTQVHIIISEVQSGLHWIIPTTPNGVDDT